MGASTASERGIGVIIAGAGAAAHLASVLALRPTYFVEYRALKIGRLVTDVLMSDPHLSADAVRRLFGANA